MEKTEGFLVENSIFKDLPRVQETFLLQDLLSKLTEVTIEIDTAIKAVQDKTSTYTNLEYERMLLELRVHQYNLVLVKEARAVTNIPINGIIFSKDTAESRKKILQNLLNENKTNKSLCDILRNELKDTKEEIRQYQKRINEYNAMTPVQLELLLIPK